MNYKIWYELEGKAQETTFTANSPVSALNMIHRWIQNTRKIGPGAYKITGIWEVYNDDPSGMARGKWIHSQLDTPGGPNPDLTPVPKDDGQEAMPFLAEATGGKLAE